MSPKKRSFWFGILLYCMAVWAVLMYCVLLNFGDRPDLYDFLLYSAWTLGVAGVLCICHAWWLHRHMRRVVRYNLLRVRPDVLTHLERESIALARKDASQ